MARNQIPLNVRDSRSDSLIATAAVLVLHMRIHESASPIAARAVAIVCLNDMGIDNATPIVDAAMNWLEENSSNPPPPPRHRILN